MRAEPPVSEQLVPTGRKDRGWTLSTGDGPRVSMATWYHPFSGRVRVPPLPPAPPAAAKVKRLASALLRHSGGTSPAVQGWPVPWQGVHPPGRAGDGSGGDLGTPSPAASLQVPARWVQQLLAVPLSHTMSLLFFTPVGMKPSLAGLPPAPGGATSCSSFSVPCSFHRRQ